MSKTFIGKGASGTGGSRSIGAAIVKRLPADGAAVALAYRASPHKADEVERAPPGRRGTPEEGAAWIEHLATPTASWMTGQVRAVDGGLSGA